MPSVPFKIDASDLTETLGLARFEEPFLVLEFQTQDAFTGTIYKTELKEIQISVASLTDIGFRQHFFGARLTIRTDTAKELADIPGNKMGEITLKFARKHRDGARELADLLDYYLRHPELSWDDERYTPLP